MGGAASGDGGGGFVATGEDFTDATGSVFGGDALEMRMRDEKAFTLGEGHGVTRDGAEVDERGARAADKNVLDGEDGLGDDGEMAREEEVIDSDDGAGEGVFDGGEKGVGGPFVDGAEGGVESGARNGGDSFAEKLDGCGFAKGAGLTLEGDTHFVDVESAHARGSL